MVDGFIDRIELKFKRIAKWFNKIGLNGPRSLVLSFVLYLWFIIGATFFYGWNGLIISTITIPVIVVMGLSILAAILVCLLQFIDEALGPFIDWLRNNWNRNVGKQDG